MSIKSTDRHSRKAYRSLSMRLRTAGNNSVGIPKRGFLPRSIVVLRAFLWSVFTLGCVALPCMADELSGVLVQKDVPYYASKVGADSRLTSLDYFAMKGQRNARIMVFVHGGGWTGGDKSNVNRSGMFKPFLKHGFVFVAINTRLVDSAKSSGTTYVEQASDIAAALRWVHDHAEEIGGDRNRINLMGYSSGAHLVALVGTDERYLARHGMKPDALESVISLDVDAYDIPRSILEAKRLGYEFAATNLKRIFGSSTDMQKDASPLYHVLPGRRYPTFLLISAGIMDANREIRQDLSKTQSDYFADKLLAASVQAKRVHLPNKKHKQLVTGFSRLDDDVAREVFSFLGK